MTTRAVVVISVLGSMLLTPLAIPAQSLEIKTPAPQRPREREPHGGLRTTANDLPGFVAPLSKETASGRAGVAGWTAPNSPVGSRPAADPDNTGWLSFGFALEWGSSRQPKGRN
jgi:hypothetical protein